MFAYIASHNSQHTPACTAALAQTAKQYGVPQSDLQQIRFPNFQLDFFDSGSELSLFKNDRYLLLLAGVFLNREAIQLELEISAQNDAELVFALYHRRPETLNEADGHLSFLVFDTQEQNITLMGDRFHRYSNVYSTGDATYVSSRSSLLYPFLDDKNIDTASFSQSIRFRWLTGQRRLFAGVNQVRPGDLTHIDKHGSVRNEAYFRVDFDRQDNLDLQHWVQQVDTAFDRTLSLIAKRHNVIGVPLSGGVDSSLMLAKATEHFKDCVAVTARFINGDNPELENARYFAKSLGVRHIIVDVDDEHIRSFFADVVRLHEQPPRNYSDIALAKTLQTLSTEVDAFLYGEAADTFFGLGSVQRLIDADRRATPFKRSPLALRRLAAMLIPSRAQGADFLKKTLTEGVDAVLQRLEEIGHVTPPCQVFGCSTTVASEQLLNDYLADKTTGLGDRATLQMLLTGVMNHIENTGRLASFFGLQMYVPFVLNDVRSVAEQLPFELQNDKGVLKKVLRELACRYFDRESIYSTKYGFPTPTTHWLKGPLRDRVTRSCNGNGDANRYYSAKALSCLSVDDDFEHFWFAICLDEILAQA